MFFITPKVDFDMSMGGTNQPRPIKHIAAVPPGAALQAKGCWPENCATCQSTLSRRNLNHAELVAGVAAVQQKVERDLTVLETQGRVPVQGGSLFFFKVIIGTNGSKIILLDLAHFQT